MGHSVSMAGTSPPTQILRPGLAGFMSDDLKHTHWSLLLLTSRTLKLTEGIKRTELKNKQTGICATSIVFFFHIFILFYFLTLQYCIGFSIYQNESAPCIHVF